MSKWCRDRSVHTSLVPLAALPLLSTVTNFSSGVQNMTAGFLIHDSWWPSAHPSPAPSHCRNTPRPRRGSQAASTPVCQAPGASWEQTLAPCHLRACPHPTKTLGQTSHRRRRGAPVDGGRRCPHVCPAARPQPSLCSFLELQAHVHQRSGGL